MGESRTTCRPLLEQHDRNSCYPAGAGRGNNRLGIQLESIWIDRFRVALSIEASVVQGGHQSCRMAIEFEGRDPEDDGFGFGSFLEEDSNERIRSSQLAESPVIFDESRGGSVLSSRICFRLDHEKRSLVRFDRQSKRLHRSRDAVHGPSEELPWVHAVADDGSELKDRPDSEENQEDLDQSLLQSPPPAFSKKENGAPRRAANMHA